MIEGVENILTQFGKDSVKAIRNEIDAQGLTDTGRAKNETTFEVEATDKKSVLSITAPAYIVSLDRGAAPIRQKTDGMFISSIQAWAMRKLGLPEKEAKGLAFGYLRKRLGDGVGGRTTSPGGDYVVPNPFNPGGLLTKGIPDEKLGKLRRDILSEIGSVYIQVTKEAIKK